MLERLDKYLSSQTELSRSEAIKEIKHGLVMVDGVLEKHPEHKVETESSVVTYNGKDIHYSKYVYIMMNKPEGILSVSNDKTRLVASDLIDEPYKSRNLFPAGRLDLTSTGFLLLTDDGDFAHNLLSPKNHVEKTYIVTTDAIPENAENCFKNGITLVDGSECMSATYKQISTDPPTAEIVLKEGKYHQIKRMLGVLNVGVNSLKRIKIGDVKLDPNLEPGQWRLLTNNEIESLTNRSN